MKNFLIFAIFFISFTGTAFADFKPLEKEVLLLKETLSVNEDVNKDDLKTSLLLIKSKVALIENEIARSDLNGDVSLLLKKYIEDNKKTVVDSKQVSYWLDHILDDIKVFIKMEITE